MQKGNPTALGTENIWKLLMQFAIPSIIAMTASSLYNIIDSIFIGQGVGPLAISGLAITFPLMNLSAAFGSLVGVGAAAIMSLRLGQKDYSTANNILGNVFLMNIVFGLIYTVVVLIFLDPILIFFGASKDTLPYAREFMIIISLGNVITHLYFGLNSLLRATGNPKKSMYTTLVSVLINLVLSPIFIFVFKWGITGAALATVIAQTSMLIWQISIFSNKNSFIHIKPGIFKFNKKIALDTLSIGISPFLMNSTASVIVIILNRGFITHGGDLYVGAYGIVNRIAFLFVMIVMGINMGMQPIAGYNYGARQTDRVNKVLKYTIMLASGVVIIGFIVCQLFPHAVASMFTTDETLINLAAQGLKVVFIFFPIVGFQMVTGNFFQSIGKAKKAILMSLTRQILFLLPGLLILPHFFGVIGIWYSMPTADILSSIVSALFLINYYRNSTIKN
ncbi:MAG: MATE family efflux transporter [Prolixibacteraceae bacterium]|nr:MATE family efflux transporter [Prolixibacteraceae bacterium]